MIATSPQQKTPQPWDFCGAILSGGESRRMGVPKAGLLLPDGRSMIERTRDMLKSFCRNVVIVGAPYGLNGHQVIEDSEKNLGPLGGLEALLGSGVASQYIVVPCDLPLAPAAFISRLSRDKGTSGMTTFQVEGEEPPRPLPCRISSEHLEDTRMLLKRGERSIRGLMKQLDDKVEHTHVASRERELLLNVNTPEEFERACTVLRRS